MKKKKSPKKYKTKEKFSKQLDTTLSHHEEIKQETITKPSPKGPEERTDLKTQKKTQYSHGLRGLAETISPLFPYLKIHLKQAGYPMNEVEYLAECIASTSIFFALFTLIIWGVLFLIDAPNPIHYAFLISVIFSFFYFFQKILLPQVVAARHVKELEKDLLPSLRMILIQLNAGVSLFDSLIAVSNEDYGRVSKEFRLIVRKVNAGYPAVNALEESASNNPSPYYRRAMWQLVNGMKSGSNTSLVLREIVDSLAKEQIIQIEGYGSQLNPLAMFYMLIAVILPSLGMTLILILSSFLNLDGDSLTLLFGAIFVFLIFFQIVFLGMIKSRRPSLIDF